VGLSNSNDEGNFCTKSKCNVLVVKPEKGKFSEFSF
jgi:hypothetical protein